jgi:hypothetical protein
MQTAVYSLNSISYNIFRLYTTGRLVERKYVEIMKTTLCFANGI